MLIRLYRIYCRRRASFAGTKFGGGGKRAVSSVQKRFGFRQTNAQKEIGGGGAGRGGGRGEIFIRILPAKFEAA
ncbi:hypothetical protein COZ39_01140 [Candidatus Roizmanbacteria bacterium CG_4_10_14_3_um_filter_33_21]|uniref:Uncharacterized protein n=1 Tax=Candidatus Roizmanbacteria bacterium CG_4_10_14_3_um_filter_33_21 TaxID=1974830 RepID=A0A2M7M0Q2_9BACT|nr:MAG: hypothetical protein COZ39_01140 [Candidatus Roizmanbacteria bacterium CG_4_10_14_3_um_filter_33_21]